MTSYLKKKIDYLDSIQEEDVLMMERWKTMWNKDLEMLHLEKK